MPPLAWRAIEDLLRAPPDAPAVPQQEYLRAAKAALGVTIAELARLIDTNPLTLRNWLRADHVGNYRRMPNLARSAIDKLLLEIPPQKRSKSR
jgi:transcriptional regulator with XRE-family HTH domain